MDRETRQSLKQDKLRETLVHGVEEVASHQRQMWLVIGIVLVVALAVGGYRLWSERQTVKAQAMLDDASKVYTARIRTAGEPEEPGEVTYVDEKNKYADAAKKFAAVADQYAGTKPGRLARYYAGLSYMQLRDYENAQRWLRMVEGSSDEELAGLARAQLAQALAGLGKHDDAVQLYQRLIAKPTTLVPKQVAMMALADLQRASKPAEAEKLYNQIKTDFPNTGFAEQAEEKLAEMKSKS